MITSMKSITLDKILADYHDKHAEKSMKYFFEAGMGSDERSGGRPVKLRCIELIVTLFDGLFDRD